MSNMMTSAVSEAIPAGKLVNQEILLKITIIAMSGTLVEGSVGSNAKVIGEHGTDGPAKRLCSNMSRTLDKSSKTFYQSSFISGTSITLTHLQELPLLSS